MNSCSIFRSARKTGVEMLTISIVQHRGRCLFAWFLVACFVLLVLSLSLSLLGVVVVLFVAPQVSGP